MSPPLSYAQSQEVVSPLTTLVNANTSDNNRMSNLADQGLALYASNYNAVNAMVVSLPTPFTVMNRTADLAIETLVDITRQLNSYLVKWYGIVLPKILNVRADSGSADFTNSNPNATFREIVAACSDATTNTWLMTLMSNLDMNYPSWDTSLALLNTTIDYNDVITNLTTDMDKLDPSAIVQDVVKVNSMGLAKNVWNTFRIYSPSLPTTTSQAVVNVGMLYTVPPIGNTVWIAPVEETMRSTSGKMALVRVATRSDNLKFVGAAINGLPLMRNFPAGKYRFRLIFGSYSTHTTTRTTVGAIIVNNVASVIASPIILPQLDAQNNVIGLAESADRDGGIGTALSWLTTDSSTIATAIVIGLDFIEYEIDSRGSVNGVENIIAFYLGAGYSGADIAMSFAFEVELLEEYNSSIRQSTLVGTNGWTTFGFNGIRTRVPNKGLRFLRWVDTSARKGVITKAVVAALTAGFSNLASSFTIAPGSTAYETMNDPSAFAGMGQSLISELYWFGQSITPVNGASGTVITALSPEDKAQLYCIWYVTMNRLLFDMIGDLTLLETYAGTNFC